MLPVLPVNAAHAKSQTPGNAGVSVNMLLLLVPPVTTAGAVVCHIAGAMSGLGFRV